MSFSLPPTGDRLADHSYTQETIKDMGNPLQSESTSSSNVLVEAVQEQPYVSSMKETIKASTTTAVEVVHEAPNVDTPLLNESPRPSNVFVGAVQEEPDVSSLKEKIKALEKENKLLKSCLNNVFNEDQIKRLRGLNCNWSEKTLEKGLHLRYLCGSYGYNALREMNFPFPCPSTLQQEMKMSRGKNSWPAKVEQVTRLQDCPDGLEAHEIKTTLS